MTGTSVAVIGLGMMGRGLAARLLDAGFDVAVYNRTRSAADELEKLGARVCATPAEAATPGGLAITMLANDAALENVASPPEGFVEKLGEGGVHISMSTISPSLATWLAAQHAAVGSVYVAAPVFGRPEAAAAGKLWIALSGEAGAKARIQPVLACLSQGVFDLGLAPEAAHVAKISGNFLIAAAVEAMAEAFALVAKNGGSAEAFHGLLAQTIFACPIYQNYGRLILGRQFSPPGFKLALGAKDIGLVLANGRETQTPLPLASLLNDRYLAALAKGRADLDWMAIALDVAADAGMPVPAAP
jgi:3-hydroxyisobutyrate dehydrogenase-like beta-hydroxyacid dehydrogenase